MTGERRVIGLTGGIGAGKSVASTRFMMLGAHVIDADILARAALNPGHACYRDVIDAFGRGIIRPDGAIDRKALARIVFDDEGRRQTLNSIIHPRVIADMLLEAQRIRQNSSGKGIVVLDVPLLFECGMERRVDCSVLVVADEITRISRVTMRDRLGAAEAAARIRTQMPQGEKQDRADFILYNNGPLEALFGQVDALYQIFQQA